MNRLLILPLFLLLLTGFGNSEPWQESFKDKQGLTWYTTLEEAHLNSKEQEKPILAFLTGSDWCKPCLQMKEDVIDTKRFAKWADENVVLLYLDYPIKKKMPKDFWQHNSGLKSKLKTIGVPVVVLFESERSNAALNFDVQELGRLVGSMDSPADFIRQANDFLKKS